MGGLSALGLLSGFGQQAHEDNLLKLQQAAQQKEAMMGFYKSIMDNPALEHMAPEAAQAFLHISSTPIDQKWDKSAQKFIKQYDPGALNQQAIERHASQHPGVQQAQQLQLPPGLTPPPRPGVPGQQVGAADGAAHQTAMNSPGVGAVAAPPQQAQQVSPAPSQQQPPPNPAPANLPPELRAAQAAQEVRLQAETTQMQQGALPSPGPVPQITPSPAQASASAGYTDPLGQAPVMPDSMVHPHWGRTPAERSEQDAYTAATQQRAKVAGTLQEQKALRRDAEQVKKDWLADPATQQAIKNHDFMTLSVTAPPGVTIPNMSSMQIPRLIGANVSGAEAAPNTIDHNGNPVDPSKHYTVRSVMGQDVWVPTDIRQSSSWMVDPANPAKEIQVHVNPYDGSVSPVAGADGKPLTRIKPGLLETSHKSSTTTDDNGNTSTESTSGKVLPSVAPTPGAVPPNVKPGTGTGSRPSTGGTGGAGGAAGGSAVIQQYADDYSAGKIKLTEIPAKQRNRVLGYMRQNGVQTPDNLSEHGKADMAQLDPVLTQIKDLKGRLEKEGLNGNDNTTALMKDYAMYRLGKDTPHNGLFTNLSFERLRSGAAAMKGTGSRAYQVLSQALDHTPNLDRAGGLLMDTPKAIYDKLVEMEHILTEGRGAILQDERRVGTVSPTPGSSNGGSGGSGSGGGGDDAVQRLINKHKGQ